MLFAELLDPASGIDKTLLPGIEGVARRTNIDAEFLLRGNGLKGVATSAKHLRGVNFGMDIGTQWMGSSLNLDHFLA